MGKIAHVNLREENSSKKPAHWMNLCINLVFKLLSASQVALKKRKTSWNYQGLVILATNTPYSYN